MKVFRMWWYFQRSNRAGFYADVTAILDREFKKPLKLGLDLPYQSVEAIGVPDALGCCVCKSCIKRC